MKKVLFFSIMAILFMAMSVFAQGNSGSIWTRIGSCDAAPQDANHYKVGWHVFIAGENFDPDTYDWSITGQPGGASCDPNVVVASGNVTVGSDGKVCIDAYVIATDDCGEYKASVGNKHDNYRVDQVEKELSFSLSCHDCDSETLKVCNTNDHAFTVNWQNSISGSGNLEVPAEDCAWVVVPWPGDISVSYTLNDQTQNKNLGQSQILCPEITGCLEVLKKVDRVDNEFIITFVAKNLSTGAEYQIPVTVPVGTNVEAKVKLCDLTPGSYQVTEPTVPGYSPVGQTIQVVEVGQETVSVTFENHRLDCGLKIIKRTLQSQAGGTFKFKVTGQVTMEVQIIIPAGQTEGTLFLDHGPGEYTVEEIISSGWLCLSLNPQIVTVAPGEIGEVLFENMPLSKCTPDDFKVWIKFQDPQGNPIHGVLCVSIPDKNGGYMNPYKLSLSDPFQTIIWNGITHKYSCWVRGQFCYDYKRPWLFELYADSKLTQKIWEGQYFFYKEVLEFWEITVNVPVSTMESTTEQLAPSPYNLQVISGSTSYEGEGWPNLIDGNVFGWEGTVTSRPDQSGPLKGMVWVVLKFTDEQLHKFNYVKMQTDNGPADDKWASRQASLVKVQVSKTGLDNFVTVGMFRIKNPQMSYYKLYSTVTATYIRLLIPEPIWGAGGWRQIVEFIPCLVTGSTVKLANESEDVEIAAADEMPTEFSLAQNYPNPFNPTTTIEYQLPEDARVVIKIYDLTGQEVATLVDEQQNAGSHSIDWNGAYLPSGTYLYRITAGNFSQVRKMTLLK